MAQMDETDEDLLYISLPTPIEIRILDAKPIELNVPAFRLSAKELLTLEQIGTLRTVMKLIESMHGQST